MKKIYMSFYSGEGCSWIPGDRKYLSKDDEVVLVDWGLDKPETSLRNIIEKLPDQHIISCVDLEEDDLSKHIYSKISKKMRPEDGIVCIIRSQGLYEMIRGIFETNKYSIKSVRSLKEARRILSKEETKESKNNLNEFFKTVKTGFEENKNVSPENCTSGRQSSLSENNDIPNGGNREKNNAGFHGMSRENNDIGKRRNRGNERISDREFICKRGGNLKNGKECEDNPHGPKDILDEIEARIFTETKDSYTVSRTLNPVSKAKASYLNTLFNRTKNNLGKYINQDVRESLRDDQYLNLMIIMAKSGDFDQFTKCWQIAGDSSFEIKLNKEEFGFLLKEVDYYMDTCDLLYEQDKWN